MENIVVRSHARKGMILSFSILFMSILIGMIGFKFFCPITWTDSFLNASMLLTGMGPVDEPESDAGKIFAGIYALYSGIIFLSITGLIMVPVFHKYIHKLNIEHDDNEVK